MNIQKTYCRSYVALALFGSLAFLPYAAMATPSGISGFSGASGSTCTLCHGAGAEVPNVTITADSGSTTVDPGSITSYTITMTGGPASVAGLDLAANGGTIIDTNSSGTRILNGELTMSSPNTVSGGTITWTFNWQAPTSTGTNRFNVAVLSGNDNGGTSGDGTGTALLNVTVAASTNQMPIAVITAPTVVMEGASVTFDGSGSSDPDGTIALYEWNFGDGSMGAGAIVTHVFAAGTYGVRLAVTDNAGAMASVIVGITVEAPNVAPTAAISGPSNGTEGTAVNFDGSGSTDMDGSIVAYDWDFGDGSAGSGATASHTYAAGSYTVALTVTDDAGATGTATMVINIAAVTDPQPPIADAGGPYAALTNDTVQLDGSASTDPDGTIMAYDWDLGDGSATTGVGPSHSYTAAGTYTVTLTVTDNDGQTGTSQSTVVITDPAPPPPPPTPNGEELWNTYCSGCHSGGVNGTSVDAINTAISNVSQMQSLVSVLSVNDIDALSAFLTSNAPPPDPTQSVGEQLYNNFCMACHGAGGVGGRDGNVAGEDAGEIQDAIKDERPMRFLGTILSRTDINAIADYLANPGGGGNGGDEHDGDRRDNHDSNDEGASRRNKDSDNDGDSRRKDSSVATSSSAESGASGGGALGWLSLLLLPMFLIRRYRSKV